MSSPEASTVDSGTFSNRRLVIPRKFAARAIQLADATDSKMRLGEVPIAAMICSGEGSGGRGGAGLDCCFSNGFDSPSVSESNSSISFSDDWSFRCAVRWKEIVPSHDGCVTCETEERKA